MHFGNGISVNRARPPCQNFCAFLNAFVEQSKSEIHLFASRNEKKRQNQSSFRCFASPFIVLLSTFVDCIATVVAVATIQCRIFSLALPFYLSLSLSFSLAPSNAIVQNNDAETTKRDKEGTNKKYVENKCVDKTSLFPCKVLLNAMWQIPWRSLSISKSFSATKPREFKENKEIQFICTDHEICCTFFFPSLLFCLCVCVCIWFLCLTTSESFRPTIRPSPAIHSMSLVVFLLPFLIFSVNVNVSVCMCVEEVVTKLS